MSNFTDFIGGSGGGGVPVGTVLPINSTDDVYVAPDGSTWLKSGTFETTDGTYPDAEYSLINTGLVGSIYVGSQASDPTAATHDGTYFYVGDDGNNRIYQYTSAGTYNTSFTSPSTTVSGLAWDGTNFWYVDRSRTLKKLNSSFGVIASYSVAAQETSPRGVTWDGSHLWVVGIDSNTAYKYTTSGVYTGDSFPCLGWGIEWDGTYFWAASGTTVRAYTSAGVNTGFDISFATHSGYLEDVTVKDGFVYGLMNGADRLYKYGVSEGYGILGATDTDSGLPLYVKVA